MDNLQAEFCKQEYTVSQSGLYLGLFPDESIQRKEKDTSCKLYKPDSTLHLRQKDGTFCNATIRNLESLASVMGPDQV